MARQDAEEKPTQERGYQVEMLRASLQRNVIVAVRYGGLLQVFIKPGR
jgi:hypothetical protein